MRKFIVKSLFCPKKGRISLVKNTNTSENLAMRDQSCKEPDWMAYLGQTYALAPDKLNRLWDEFVNRTAITVKEYIVQRHSQLKAQGWQNKDIYSTLINEIREQRFKAQEYSIRQIRRMIYG